MTDRFILERPVEVVVAQEVENPDAAIEKLVKHLAQDPVRRAQLEAIQALSKEQKSAWLLGLETRDPAAAGTKEAGPCVLVVVLVTVAVIVGWHVVNGVREALTRQEQQRREILKCAGGQGGSSGGGGSQGGGSGSDHDMVGGPHDRNK
jgi:uncharacterized membrane protein YgcG